MFSITELPRIAGKSLPPLGTYLAPALKRGGESVEDGVIPLSPGSIADSWQVKPLAGEGIAAVGVMSNHPGALPLDQGAHWPGKMPPWGEGSSLAEWAIARGKVPFLVARKLQREGMTARHFGQKGLLARRTDVVNIVRRDGLQRWLKEISRA